jgi:hypothetical protein
MRTILGGGIYKESNYKEAARGLGQPQGIAINTQAATLLGPME